MLECTKEFLSNLEKEFSQTELQNKFNDFIKKQHEKFFYQRSNNQHNLLKQEDSLKMIRMFKSSQGALCDVYLKNNSTF